MSAIAPSGRPIESIDTHAPVSLARQFLAERDRPGNLTDQRACEIIRQLLRWMDTSVDRAYGPLAFDRNLVADMLRHPLRYRSDVVSMQAALVQGTLGLDSPFVGDAIAKPRVRRQHEDNGA